MNRISVRLLLILAILALLGEGQVRAEMVNFSYHWDILPNSVISGTGPNNTGSVQFSPVADGTGSYTINTPVNQPSLIPGATLTTLSSATSPPDSFNTTYALKLTLTDLTNPSSPVSGSLTFSGTLSGTLTKSTSQLTGTFAPGTVTQSDQIGSHVYTVTIDPALVNLPAPNTASASGSGASTAPVLIDAFVSAVDAGTPPGSGPSPSNSPEPSSLVLAATALLGVAARRWSRS